jgi:hypothetical protein
MSKTSEEKIKNIQIDLAKKLEEINQKKNEKVAKLITEKDRENIEKVRQEINDLN